MIINDNRGKQRNLKMGGLTAGDVSVLFVDVEDGSVYRTEDVKDYDEYISVKARVEIE